MRWGGPLAALLLVTACQEVMVELDPSYVDPSDLCAGTICSQLPRCADGGSDCIACSCCPCTEGETICDPLRWNVLWRCEGGCYVDVSCGPSASCAGTAGSAGCLDDTIDCLAVHPYERVLVCDETEEMCARCEGCLTCYDLDGLGLAQTCDDFRPSGSPRNRLLCDGATSCLRPEPCPDTEHCVSGAETGGAVCSGAADCQQIGCTGYPICDQPASACGDCGCCDVSVVPPEDTCGFKDGSMVRYVFDVTAGCYDGVYCSAEEVCAFDSYQRAICVEYW